MGAREWSEPWPVDPKPPTSLQPEVFYLPLGIGSALTEQNALSAGSPDLSLTQLLGHPSPGPTGLGWEERVGQLRQPASPWGPMWRPRSDETRQGHRRPIGSRIFTKDILEQLPLGKLFQPELLS